MTGTAKIFRRTCVAAAIVAMSVSLMTTASAAPPVMTRSEIIARAETALGLTYGWGRESWMPNAGYGTGSDCSGLVLKCWEVPKTLLYEEEAGVNATISPRYTTYQFYHCLGPWYALASRADLKEGDILVKRNSTSGHVVLYAGGDSWNYPVIYEAPGTGLKIRKVSRYLGSEYLPRRRTQLWETSTIVLDNPTAKSVGGTDIWSNWARGSYWPGYWGSGYQATDGTTAESWARWTPRIPQAGYYDVYLRWTSCEWRTAAAKVVIRGDLADYASYVDQRTGGGEWHWVGCVHMRAGYSIAAGSVTLYATGAVGQVCADAARFILRP